ncbi:autotransporter outer membrane beta-barrel domain-containing protein [Kluyvera georgiana]|uniref:autotransporter outer membrane beta-barrel domain-containing protein n=1 Tax=Kluyvera georgiana TaxID=73098 RepID=UPI003F67DB94
MMSVIYRVKHKSRVSKSKSQYVTSHIISAAALCLISGYSHESLASNDYGSDVLDSSFSNGTYDVSYNISNFQNSTGVLYNANYKNGYRLSPSNPSGEGLATNHIFSDAIVSVGSDSQRVYYSSGGAAITTGGWDADSSRKRYSTISGGDVSLYLDGSNASANSYAGLGAGYGGSIFLNNFTLDIKNANNGDINGLFSGVPYNDKNPNGKELTNTIHISNDYTFSVEKKDPNNTNPVSGIRAIENNSGKVKDSTPKPILGPKSFISVDGKYTANINSNYGNAVYVSGYIGSESKMPEVSLNDAEITISGRGNAFKVGKAMRPLYIWDTWLGYTANYDGWGAGKLTFKQGSNIVIDQSDATGEAISLVYGNSILDASKANSFKVISKDSAIIIGNDMLDAYNQASDDLIYAGFNNADFSQTSDSSSSMILVDSNQKNAALRFTGSNTMLVAADKAWLLDVRNSSNVEINASGNGGSMTGLSTMTNNAATNNTLNIILDDGFSWNLNKVDDGTATGKTTAAVTSLSLKNGAVLNSAYNTGVDNNYKLTGSTINDGGVVNLYNASNSGHHNTLTLDGNYTGGNNASLIIGTVLGNDSSKTDKLVISGAATGKTVVSVVNEGGLGAQTNEGILIIETASSTSDAFVQSGRIVAGSYDYHLQQGTASGQNTNNWYLTNKYVAPTPIAKPTIRVYRPETGAYTSNLVAANTMFNMTLHDRLGETQYTDALTGEQKVTSMWMRAIGGRSAYAMQDTQNHTTANRYVSQIGGDISQWSTNGLDRYHLGIMAGYAIQHSKTRNNLTDYNAKGTINGYSAGLYGTWYANNKDNTGLYVDTWALYNWFDNEVKGDELSSESYKSNGVTASVETGYTFHPGSYTTNYGMVNNFYIQPQAQVTWMGVEADDHTESNGTRVSGKGGNNIQTRLGVRFFINGKSRIDEGTEREFEPFIETNWIYNTKTYGTAMNGESDYMSGTRNVGELKVGVESKITNTVNLWGSVAQRIGDTGYSDTQGLVGVKYMFK